MFFLMGFVTSTEQLIVLRGLQGLVTGVIAAASALVASVTPRQHTGYAMGWLQVGLWSGHAAGPVVGGVLSDLVGYRAIFVVTAAMLLLSGVSVWIGIQDPFVRVPAGEGTRPGLLQGCRRILTNPRLAATLGLRFLTSVGRTTVGPILPLFVLQLLRGSSGVGTFTGLITGVESATSTLTSVYLGKLGDRIGYARVALASAILTAILYLPQGFATDVWQLFFLHALSGFGVGGLIPSLSALLAQHSREGDEGAVYGIENSVTAAARVVAPLLASACALWFSPGAVFLLTALVFVSVALLAALTVSRTDAPSA